MRPFDLFERVRTNTTSSLFLLPIEEVVERSSSMDLIKQHWADVVGAKLPRSLCYVIYDKSAELAFLGLIQYIYYNGCIPEFQIVFYFHK